MIQTSWDRSNTRLGKLEHSKNTSLVHTGYNIINMIYVVDYVMVGKTSWFGAEKKCILNYIPGSAPILFQVCTNKFIFNTEIKTLKGKTVQNPIFTPFILLTTLLVCSGNQQQ